MDSIEEFRKQLRSTLNHLYDPDYLRRSPLAALLNLSGRFETPVALQRTLEEAIEGLRPDTDIPINSHAWHTYDILVSRYIHQLNQDEVANQIGVSTRQLVREQDTALEILSGKLWNEYHLSEKMPNEAAEGMESEQPLEELSWLKEAPADQLTDLQEEIEIVISLIQSLAERHDVQIVINQSKHPSKMPVHPVAFRQGILSVISLAVSGAKGGTVRIEIGDVFDQRMEITVIGSRTGISLPHDRKEEEDLQLAKKIIEMIRGEIEIKRTSRTFSAQISLPVVQPVKVLVIDDNSDFLSLFQRYTSGTRFAVVGTRKPDEIFSLIEYHHPQGIILDIMMPEIDGWQILAKLHHHPLTSQIPIFICSIVSNEELASTLGASGYIRKPVTRESLLKMLEKIAEYSGSTPG